MPDCSHFQQIVNDRRAKVNKLKATFDQDLKDCASVGGPREVAQCRAQVKAHLADAEAALNAAEADFQECVNRLEAQGRITFLRVQDQGIGFGSANDFLEVEAVILLDSQPGKGFGFQLRDDQNRPTREAMLQLLRDAFAGNEPVTIDFVRSTGKNNGTVVGVTLTKQAVV